MIGGEGKGVSEWGILSFTSLVEMEVKPKRRVLIEVLQLLLQVFYDASQGHASIPTTFETHCLGEI
jgi:hypothetical protein